MPCEIELERESRILLQIMIKRPHFIRKLPFDQLALYRVQGSSANQCNFLKTIDKTIVSYMCDKQLLKLDGNKYYHTLKAEDWLGKFLYFVNIERNRDVDKKRSAYTSSKDTDNQKRSSHYPIHDVGKSDKDYAPILKLYNRQRNIEQKYLTKIHVEAAEQLFAEFIAANLQPKLTFSWDNISVAPQTHYTGSKMFEYSEKIMTARKTLYDSLHYVGEDFCAILVEICLFGNGLENTEKNFKWPARSGKLLLTMALDKLAEFYGIDVRQSNERKYLGWIESEFRHEAAQFVETKPNGG